MDRDFKYILVDFDGTVVTHDFPRVGKDIGAVPVLKKLVANGHKLILWTMRSDIENPISNHPEIIPIGGQYLTDALNWFRDNGIELYGVQENPSQKGWTTSPKAYGEICLDDNTLFAPLKLNPNLSNRPFYDWEKAEQELIRLRLIPS